MGFTASNVAAFQAIENPGGSSTEAIPRSHQSLPTSPVDEKEKTKELPQPFDMLAEDETDDTYEYGPGYELDLDLSDYDAYSAGLSRIAFWNPDPNDPGEDGCPRSRLAVRLVGQEEMYEATANTVLENT